MNEINILNTYLRRADNNDINITYNWANDKETRNNSFSSKPIDMETHIRWFSNKLSDNNCYMFILTDGSNNIGIIRLDYDLHSSFVISYSIDSNYRRLGLGTRIIELAEYEARNICKTNSDIIYIIGRVKTSNIGSRKCFENNKYSLLNNTDNELTYQKKL